MMTIKVEFKKSFTKGMMKGSTVNDKIRFPNMESATNWVEGIKANKNVPYTISDVSYILS